MKEPFIVRPIEEDEYFFKEGCYILELLNCPDDPALSIARARVKPGITTRLHRLQGTIERYIILEGVGRIEVGGRPSEQVAPGAVVVIPPDVDQRITNTGEKDLVFLALCTPRFQPEAYVDSEAGA